MCKGITPSIGCESLPILSGAAPVILGLVPDPDRPQAGDMPSPSSSSFSDEGFVSADSGDDQMMEAVTVAYYRSVDEMRCAKLNLLVDPNERVEHAIARSPSVPVPPSPATSLHNNNNISGMVRRADSNGSQNGNAARRRQSVEFFIRSTSFHVPTVINIDD